MQFVLAVGVIVYSIFLSHGEGTDCQTERPFTICRDSDIITSVTKDPKRYEKRLKIGDAQDIASNAFKDLDIQELIIVRTEAYWRPRPLHTLSLHPDSFTGLRNLTTLKFSEVKLTYEGKPLIPLGSLKELTLEDVEFTEVPSDFFSGSNLTKLHMKDNSLNVIRPNAFSALKHLELLSLRDNDIKTLEPGCFDGLEELNTLDLSFNKLTLTPGIFSPLKKLNSLDLHDSVKTFNAQAFRGLPNLTKLIISKNHIILEPGMFDDSPGLEDIHARHCRFRHIPKNVFNHLTCLHFLTFSLNDIRSIEPGAFSGTKVNTLNLEAGYHGRVIQPGVFSNLTVGKLMLSWNDELDMRPGAFDGMKAESLVLRGNNFIKIPAWTFTGADIKKVDLSINSINEFERNAFSNATIASIVVDSERLLSRNRSTWGIPDYIEVKFDAYQ